MLLFVGTFMDMSPAILIFTPILLPVMKEIGVDPVHFGIIMIANLCIGLCTPPVGTCLFVGCSIGKGKIEKVAVKMIPLFIALFFALMVITYWSPLSLWLPNKVEELKENWQEKGKAPAAIEQVENSDQSPITPEQPE
jgi:TRAP-type C4-dicarboxylate transport system permease large subunit